VPVRERVTLPTPIDHAEAAAIDYDVLVVGSGVSGGRDPVTDERSSR
jgi:hypothetical protein